MAALVAALPRIIIDLLICTMIYEQCYRNDCQSSCICGIFLCL